MAGPDNPGPRRVPWPAIFVAIPCILIGVTGKLGDPDILQHLIVGKSIWADHAVRGIHRWSWPMYGHKEVTDSWLFCALVYPFWGLGGVGGLFVWRWATTLTAFAVLYATAVRAGSSPAISLVALVWASLIYCGRSGVRPETLTVVLMALELLILESRRLGMRDRSVWLIPILWFWTNAHASYVFGLFIMAAYLLDDLLRSRSKGPGANTGRLAVMSVAAGVSGVLGPFGWRSMALPFVYQFEYRHELIYQAIGELGPISWSAHADDGLMLLMIVWGGFATWRMIRRGVDIAEVLVVGFFLVESLASQRFVGFFSLVAGLFLARDVSHSLPAMTRRLELLRYKGDLTAGVCCVLIGLRAWTAPGLQYGIGWNLNQYPVEAVNFMSRTGVHGRGFNYFWQSGYLLSRAWPGKENLPFMDVHQFGSTEDRDLHTRAQFDSSAWRRLERKYPFDYVLLSRDSRPIETLPAFLDQDSTWAMVFNDDAAVLYVRRASQRPIAERYAYGALKGSDFGMARILRTAAGDTATRRALREDATRQVRSSAFCARGHVLQGVLAAMDGDSASARHHLEEALTVDPWDASALDKLGLVALWERDYRTATHAFGLVHRIEGSGSGYDFRMGEVYAAQGDVARAHKAYERELQQHPGNAEARDSLEALRRRANSAE